MPPSMRRDPASHHCTPSLHEKSHHAARATMVQERGRRRMGRRGKEGLGAKRQRRRREGVAPICSPFCRDLLEPAAQALRTCSNRRRECLNRAHLVTFVFFLARRAGPRGRLDGRWCGKACSRGGARAENVQACRSAGERREGRAEAAGQARDKSVRRAPSAAQCHVLIQI